jgi:hypothetical protein
LLGCTAFIGVGQFFARHAFTQPTVLIRWAGVQRCRCFVLGWIFASGAIYFFFRANFSIPSTPLITPFPEMTMAETAEPLLIVESQAS